jgi:hypothetical protein
VRDLEQDPHTTDERVLRRAAIEDPRFPHEDFTGQVFSLAYEDFGDGEVIREVAAHEAKHPANLLAQTMQLVLDEAAVISKFPQEEQ